jgi:hypothetical protein
MKRNLHNLLVLACIAVSCSATWAGTIYGNNATFGAPYVYVFDSGTGAITNTITNLSGDNGRGVVVVGDTLYYTTASTNSVFSYTLSTSTDNGALFTVTGSSALSTMAFDGTNFWIGDYSGTNHAYLYSPTGTLLNTISLADCTGFCDGLEYFVDGGGNARLISNEGDGETPGVYDVYDTSGNLITHDFINTGRASGTGIAYDGTDFYVSNIYEGQISVYSNTGAFIRTESLTGFPGSDTPLVEDLSADYALVLTGTPEPGTFAMLGAGLLGLLGAVKSRKRS